MNTNVKQRGLLLAASIGVAAAVALPGQKASAQKTTGSWKVVYSEKFDTYMPQPEWHPDTYPDDGGPYTEMGSFFQQAGILPPPAFRASAAFGQNGWLTLESYTRPSESDPNTPSAQISDLASVQPDPDPANPTNRVLRIASPQHTDGTIVRPTQALPDNYRVSLRVGYPRFGDGMPGGLNGYDRGDESGLPWRDMPATQENGFYWMAIWDKQTRPHNNVDAHHHRKVIIDSDNNQEGWTYQWDGKKYVSNGQHPVMMFAVSPKGTESPYTGLPPISYTRGKWDTSGYFRTVDAYKDMRWYNVSIAKQAGSYTLTVEGDFKSGQHKYSGTISGKQVYHSTGFPDYFVFGDPHINFYEGEVYYDNVTLEQWSQ